MGRVHLCRVAGNTVWSHMASDASSSRTSSRQGLYSAWTFSFKVNFWSWPTLSTYWSWYSIIVSLRVMSVNNWTGSILVLLLVGTPCYSNSPQSGRWVADCSWIGLRAVPIGKMPNQIPKIRGTTIMLRGTGIPPQAPRFPWSPPGALIIAVLSIHPMPRPPSISPNFFYFYICLSVLKMHWVVLTADCRNRVCRNSVCLPLLVITLSVLVCLWLFQIWSLLRAVWTVTCWFAFAFTLPSYSIVGFVFSLF